MKWDVVAAVATAIVPIVAMAAAYFSWFVKITYRSQLAELMEKLDQRFVRRNGGVMTLGEIERQLAEIREAISHSPTPHRHVV